jgi:hypothetical protein
MLSCSMHTFPGIFQEKVHMTGLVGDDGMKGKKQFYY